MPSEFVCEKGHRFVYPAKQSEATTRTVIPSLEEQNRQETIVKVIAKETHRCPYCDSLDLSVVEDEQPTVGVYVADLHTGVNTEIDDLLAKGWVITGRYAKQYVLELKEAPKPEAKTDA